MVRSVDATTQHNLTQGKEQGKEDLLLLDYITRFTGHVGRVRLG